jgi:hypothetical protein
VNGRIEAAQEKLEIAAHNWQKARNDLEFLSDFDREKKYRDLAFERAEKQLDKAVTNLRHEMDEYLKEKGSIPR